jgi:hypothetical protein
MIYPRFMVVNKNTVSMICEGQTLNGLSSNYLNMLNTYNKVSFKVPGYKTSKGLDISTIGLSGSLELDVEKANDV